MTFKKIIGSALQFLIHSNLFIAFAGMMMTIQTQIELGLAPHFRPYLLLIFFATLFDYNLHRVNTLLKYPQSLQLKKYEWLRSNIPTFYIILGISITGFIISLFYARRESILSLTPLAIITLFYSMPFIKIGGKKIKLRDIPYLKIFIISLVWSCVTIILPYMESDKTVDWQHLILMIVIRYVFIFAITIPFDIRDTVSDAEHGLKTIAHLQKEKQLYGIASGLVILMLVLAAFNYLPKDGYAITAAYICSAACTIYVLRSEKLRKDPFYHHGYLDACMIIQAAFVILFDVLRKIF